MRKAVGSPFGAVAVQCRGIVASSVALLATLGMGATEVLAQCAVAGLAGSSMDATTSQALEIIRDRRMQVAQACPAGTVPSATGACVPASAGSVTPSSAQQAPAAPKRKAAAPKAAPVSTPGAGYGGGMKDDVADLPTRRVVYGVWAEGHADRERRSNIDSAGESVKSRSAGVLSGIDHTYLRGPREGIQIGALAGYTHTRNEFSGSPTGNAARDQEVDAAVLGIYGTYFHRGFAIDALFKSDIGDLDQVSTGCANPASTGSTSLTNYVFATNIYHRHNFGHMWLEPTAGLRYLHTSFGSGAADLGLDDGEALRLQAGLRIGTDWVRDRRLWSLSFLAGIYSDVLVDGFTLGGGGGGVTVESDEGKVRALGQLRASVRTDHGLSYYGQAEIRGGEDYFGIGGKLGLRYEW